MSLSADLQLHNAYVTADRHEVIVGTGLVTRAWTITPQGPATRLLTLDGVSSPWVIDAPPMAAYSLRGLIQPGDDAELVGIDAASRQDVDYTSDHIELTLRFRYHQAGFDLRYTIWVYPDAPGIRTQLAIMPTRPHEPDELPSYLGDGRTERLPLSTPADTWFAAGYYNDTQHRNYDHTPLLRSQAGSFTPGHRQLIDWSNLVALERHGQGLAVVKESHKCVNQDGVDTGGFILSSDRVEVTGLGLTPAHYGGGFWADNNERWRDCWATWTVVYGFAAATERESCRQLAIKQMDRLRFPFRPERDRLAMSNTWGSGGAGEGSRSAAEQSNVIRELASAADLGIEIVQIDDGWQAAPNEERPTVGERDWRPSPARWPDEWRAVRREADRLGVDLGLWFPWYVDTQKIAWNLEHGGFRRVKLDFMHLGSRHDIEHVESKVRTLVQRFGPRLDINWDATEVNARMGYYFGRDHGNIYLANRENGPPPLTRLNHIRYTPRLVLRDAWHLAHYVNLNAVQISIQNKQRVVADLTNCRDYPHDYCFAITMMGVPLFFQETHYYDEEARRQLRPIVRLYKQHRDDMQRGLVFPVGDEPDDHRWTGFQSHDPQSRSGHLLLFREVHNSEPETSVQLRFLSNTTLQVHDVTSGDRTSVPVDPDGRARFTLTSPASFRWLQYQ